MIGTYNLLVNWKQDPRSIIQVLGSGNDGASFALMENAQGMAAMVNNDGGGRRRVKSHITCHNCGKKGHYANECPNGSDEEEARDGK